MTVSRGKSAKYKDTLRPHYDLTNAVPGKNVKRFPEDVEMVTLEPDVAAAFPDADSVNEALRVVVKVAKRVIPEVSLR